MIGEGLGRPGRRQGLCISSLSEPRTFKAKELWERNGAVIMAVRRPGCFLCRAVSALEELLEGKHSDSGVWSLCSQDQGLMCAPEPSVGSGHCCYLLCAFVLTSALILVLTTLYILVGLVTNLLLSLSFTPFAQYGSSHVLYCLFI